MRSFVHIFYRYDVCMLNLLGKRGELKLNIKIPTSIIKDASTQDTVI